jgi:hypothetical protein
MIGSWTNPHYERKFMQPETKPKPSNQYDGIYFLPYEDEEQEGLLISYFDFKNEMAGGEPIETTPVGSKYHIAFFKADEEGNPTFDESFEAILGDPGKYIENLSGAGVYGCVVKKTTKSSKWFDNYLKRALEHIKIHNMVGVLKSIAETK